MAVTEINSTDGPALVSRYSSQPRVALIKSAAPWTVSSRSLRQLAERDIVHNTLLALCSLQLDGGNLHQEGVLVAVEFEKVVIQLGYYTLLVAAIEIPVKNR